MSNAIKIGKGDKDNKPKPKISQSIPAHFYRNYIPPKTPSIKPMAPPNQVPDFEPLPKISPSGKGINLQQGGSFSLQRNKHPMSMPAKGALFGPSGKTPFDVKGFQAVAKKDDEIKEETEPNSLEQQTKKLKVGSFTCFEVMNSPLKQLPESADKIQDKASEASASTFDDKNAKPPSDEEPDEEEEEDDADAEAGGFDMEL